MVGSGRGREEWMVGGEEGVEEAVACGGEHGVDVFEAIVVAAVGVGDFVGRAGEEAGGEGGVELADEAGLGGGRAGVLKGAEVGAVHGEEEIEGGEVVGDELSRAVGEREAVAERGLTGAGVGE